MMSTIYDFIQDNSTTEYRWAMTREITQQKMTPWPVPLNVLQGPIGCCAFCYAICLDKDIEHKKDEEEKAADPDVKRLLYANMAISYFRETLSEEDYKNSLLFDSWEDSSITYDKRHLSRRVTTRRKLNQD